jgi:hypothetical protein
VNFGVGDYVLVSIPDTPKQRKLTMRWHGSYKVVEARDMYVFNVEDIVTNERQKIHGSRLLLYADSQFNVIVDIQQQKQHDAQGGLYSIESIVDVNEDTQEILIEWTGFPDEMNTWEPLAEFEAMAPKWLSNF